MRIVSVTVLLLALSGCAGVHNAEQYAGSLRGVLASYQKEVARKVKAEQDAYNSLAPIYDSVDVSQKLNTLSLERLERASALTDDIMALRDAGKQLTMSELRVLLRDYGTMDFSMTRDMLAREMNAAGQRLAALEAFSAQIEQAQTLDSVLKDLSQPRSKLTNLKGLATYAESAKNCLDEKRCAALKTEVDGLQSRLKTATVDADKKRLADQLKQAQDAQAKNCNPPPTCGATK